jgi:ABC-type sugar transport system permease subunit
MLFSLALTTMDWSLLSAPTFVGLDNVERMIDDDLFYVALYNTAYYTLLAVPLHLLIALVIALAVNLPLRGINAIRTVYYMPSITPQVASIILWLWIFNPEFGLANALIRAVVQVHVKGVRGAGLDAGTVDLGAVKQALGQVGYDDWLLLETAGGDDPLANARANLAVLRRELLPA